MKRVNSIHESLEKREIFVLEKEKEVNSKMQVLGISKFNAMSLEKDNQIPTIFFITPTYKRLTQKADLTRLSQTLLHVPKLHWILVEDSHEKTNLVQRFLAGCGVQFSHLAVRTPKQLITKEGDPRWLKARGVEQRNLGLKWIRQNYKDGIDGVIYFGDDDNTYDLKIFEQVGQNWPIQFVCRSEFFWACGISPHHNCCTVKSLENTTIKNVLGFNKLKSACRLTPNTTY